MPWSNVGLRTSLVGQNGVHHAQLLVQVGRARGCGRVRLRVVHTAVTVDEQERLPTAPRYLH